MLVEESEALVITDVMKTDETEMLIDCLLNNKPLPEDKTKENLGKVTGNVLSFLKDVPEMSQTM